MRSGALKKISRELSKQVGRLSFSEPVRFVYNPLQYARAPHEDYLEKFADLGAKILLMGMNPGPFGMAQTGVPFGEVELVRDWMKVRGTVSKPKPEHPKRPVLGFECPRSEVSGRRLWGWAQQRFVKPENFFKRFFVVNYCPLVFMEESGRNFTPDKLPAEERAPLFEACDRALQATAEVMQAEQIIGVGKFAERRAQLVVAEHVKVGTVLHPSPASPVANRGWAEAAEKQFLAQGVALD